MGSKTVTVEPIYVYTDTHDKSVKKSHKCGCEKCLFGENNADAGLCPTGIGKWCDFRIYVNGSGDGCGTCSIICFPIVFPTKLLLCFPCASYNSCRNKCNGTKDLNYIF
jgi:hypothetical protein